MIDTTRRRAARISKRHGEQSTPLGSMLEKRGGTHAKGNTRTTLLFFHEINTFPAHKTQHARDVHVICDACQHGVVINLRRAEDRFSTPTSLVLTFCRNTVEVKDVRRGGGEEKAQKKKRNIDSRSAKHQGERGCAQLHRPT